MIAPVFSVDAIFQSTRPSRDGTSNVQSSYGSLNVISIHPPLAGRDAGFTWSLWACVINFNPPAPRGTGRDCKIMSVVRGKNFNPPAPRGTGPVCSRTHRRSDGFQSTRPSRDGTVKAIEGLSDKVISIHPPLAGRDQATTT